MGSRVEGSEREVGAEAKLVYYSGWTRMCCRNKQPHSLTPTQVCFPLPFMGLSRLGKGTLFISHLGARPEKATVPNVTSHRDRTKENPEGSFTGH